MVCLSRIPSFVWLAVLRSVRGAVRRLGCLTNLLSLATDVGKSSNRSSSVPSPKLRRLAGRVTVLLAAASLASEAGARSRLWRVGVSGTNEVESRECARGIGDWARDGSDSRRE